MTAFHKTCRATLLGGATLPIFMGEVFSFPLSAAVLARVPVRYVVSNRYHAFPDKTARDLSDLGISFFSGEKRVIRD